MWIVNRKWIVGYVVIALDLHACSVGGTLLEDGGEQREFSRSNTQRNQLERERKTERMINNRITRRWVTKNKRGKLRNKGEENREREREVKRTREKKGK